MSKHLNLYAIEFIGHWPVGAVAVVRSASREEAIDSFMFKLSQEEPILYNHQDRDKLDVTQLASTRDMCTILLNGEY